MTGNSHTRTSQTTKSQSSIASADGVDFQTCTDVKPLGAHCCPVCHDDSPEWELEIVETSGGVKALVCCAVKSALFPLTPDEQAEADEKMRAVFGVIFADLEDDGLREVSSDRPEDE